MKFFEVLFGDVLLFWGRVVICGDVLYLSFRQNLKNLKYIFSNLKSFSQGFVLMKYPKQIFILLNIFDSNCLEVLCGDVFVIFFVSTEIKTSKLYSVKFENFFHDKNWKQKSL